MVVATEEAVTEALLEGTAMEVEAAAVAGGHQESGNLLAYAQT